MKLNLLRWAALAALGAGSLIGAEMKHALVVTAVQGYAHSSRPLAEKVIAALGDRSGLFDVDYARGGADGKGSEDVVAKMSREALKKYDVVIFANTTGDLPLPEPMALIDFVRDGKAFVGMHSAGDTFHHFKPYLEMVGAEFVKHHDQARVDCVNQDREHPATRHLGPVYSLLDEIYLYTNFTRAQVHGLLTMEKHPNTGAPGDFPVAWTKEFGKGRVFYTSLGHREDVWLSEDYQKHVLGGIKFALGLEKANSKPQDTGFQLSREEKREGFKALFDGKSLAGWKTRRDVATNSWTVQNGMLVNTVSTNAHGVDLVSDEKFRDFVVRFEYMVPKGANSGFYLRGRHEIQILDDADKKEPGLGGNGAIYQLKPTAAMVSRRAGDWQSCEARMEGNLVTVYLNGVKIHEKVKVDRATGSELDRNVDQPGPILLQGDHGSVAFRKVRIRKL